MKNIFYLLSLCTFLLVGCENNDLLRSEKKIKEQLEANKWQRIRARPDDNTNDQEFWVFKSGTVTITQDRNSNGTLDTNDVNIHALYSVDTKVSSSYVTLTNIPLNSNLYGYEQTNMNYKWTIAEINNDVLYLSTATESGTLRSLEYIKVAP